MQQITLQGEVEGKTVFQWRLKEFSTLDDRANTWCSSPPFFFGGRHWDLCLSPKSLERGQSEGYIVLALRLCCSDPPIEATYSLCIRTAKGKTGVCRRGTKVFDSSVRLSASDSFKFIKRSELLRRRDELLPQDVLTVTLQMKLGDGSSGTVLQNGSVQATVKNNVAGESVQATVERNVANASFQEAAKSSVALASVQAIVERNVADVSVQTAAKESVSRGEKGEISGNTESLVPFDPNLESLSLEFGELLEDQVLPDVKLLCADRKISAHRAVLAARSEVFAAMFINDTEESKTGIVDLPDLDARVLDIFLRFVYTGKILYLSKDLLPGVYAAGDKYAVHSLKKACSDRMIAGLTEGNCASFLAVADAHSDAPFKDEVVSFICRREAIFQSEVWLSFAKKHLELTNEVYESYFRSKNRTIVDSAPSFSGDGADNELAQPAKRRKFCR